jgi:hypothetical protein
MQSRTDGGSGPYFDEDRFTSPELRARSWSFHSWLPERDKEVHRADGVTSACATVPQTQRVP